MRRLFFYLFLAGFVLPSALLAQSNTGIEKTLVKNEFEAHTQKWVDVYNSKNAQNLVTLYAEDAVFLSSHVAGLEAIGRDKLIANFQNGINMGGHID